MKNVFFLILLLVIGSSVFGQSWNTITGKNSFSDSMRALKYKNNAAGDSILSTDITGKFKNILRPGGGTGYVTFSVRGDFIYDSLLYFHSTAYQYYILGRYFTAPYTSHLLTPPNPSAARNDVAFVDTLNSASIITGVNGGGVPATNPVSQFKIGEIHINAADTVPSNFSNVIAYRNNLEWIASSSIAGFNNAYATAPFTGTSTSMYVPSFVNGETISLLRDTLLNISNASYLKVFVWLNASFSAANLNFSFNNLGNAATTSVPLLNGQFGYVSTLVGSWQEVNIPMAYFQLFSNSIDEIIIGMTGANASGFKIGNVVIQFGGLPTSSAIGGIQAVNDNYGPKVYFSVTDTGYVDSDTTNYVYKDKRTNTVLFTLPTYLKNLVSNRTAADTCIVLDTLGRTIFISLNPYCKGGVDATAWHITGNAGTTAGTNFLGTTDAIDLVFKSNGTEGLRLKNGGNIGVNVTSPAYKLDVDGDMNVSIANVYRLNTVPVIRAKTASSNYYFGNSGNATLGGTSNTGVGDASLFSITNGFSNTGVGGSALGGTTTGDENTALGQSSLGSNIIGDGNSTIGAYSLANSTGNYNSALGYYSLSSNGTGSSNIGLGTYSGYYNTTASNQVFINSIDRVNYLGDTTASPIWIQQDATSANQRIKLNGQLHFSLGAGAGKILTSDATGFASWQTPTAPTSYTGSNGITLTGSDFTFGGTLTGNTTIATGSFGTTFSTATSLIDPLKAIATNGIAVTGTATNGTGVYGTVTSGSGIYGVATTGVGLVGTNTSSSTAPTISVFKTTSAAANSVLNVVDIGRQTGGTAANGLGSSVRFITETSGGTNTVSNQIKSEWTDATTGTVTSKFTVTGINSTTEADLLTISGSGATQLNKYGIGTFISGTPTYGAAWDASGNLMEVALGGGGTVTNIATGLGLSGGPITTTGTLLIDTASVSILSRQRAAATYWPSNSASADIMYKNGERFFHTTGLNGGGDVNENLAIGYKAGNALAGNGYANTIVGKGAALLLNGTAPNGSSNTIVGYQSFPAATTASYNTAVGTATMSSMTTQQLGTAIGYHAMINATGPNSTAVGAYALRSNTATNITALGYEALYSNTSGTFNTAFGTQALRSNTTGTANTALGYLTLYNNINTSSLGFANTAVGSRALTANTTGYVNTAVGEDAGFSNTTGHSNTFVGRDAGYTNLTGIENIYIGKNSNYAGTGSGNIVIGKDISTSVAGASNELNMGGLLFGVNTYNATTGRLGVSVAAPTARLHLPAGSASASLAPQKFTAGTLQSTIEALTIETNASSIYQSTVALNRYATGGAIKNFITTVDNGTTVETDLYTYTTKANTLVADGETITFKLAGTFNDITATAQLQFYFGGTNIGNTGTLTVSATGGWNADIMIIRTSSTTARSIVTVNTPGASTALYTTQTDITGLTLSGTNIIKVTGTAGGASGGSGDISAKLGTIFFWGAANN